MNINFILRHIKTSKKYAISILRIFKNTFQKKYLYLFSNYIIG